MPSNNIAFVRNYTSVIDEVYQIHSVGCIEICCQMSREQDYIALDALDDNS